MSSGRLSQLTTGSLRAVSAAPPQAVLIWTTSAWVVLSGRGDEAAEQNAPRSLPELVPVAIGKVQKLPSLPCRLPGLFLQRQRSSSRAANDTQARATVFRTKALRVMVVVLPDPRGWLNRNLLSVAQRHPGTQSCHRCTFGMDVRLAVLLASMYVCVSGQYTRIRL